jgi:hypothetical protein
MKKYTLFVIVLLLSLVVDAQVKRTIHVATAGTLSNYISEDEKYQIEELTLTGEINGDDLGFITDMAGVKHIISYWRDTTTDGKLSVLDISNANIVAGGCYSADESQTSHFDYVYNYLTDDNTIPKLLFANCNNFTKIILPKNLKSIGSWAFCGCNGLTSIVIPATVSSINEAAFSSCKSLSSINVEAGNMFYDSRNNCNAIINKNNQLIVGCKNSVIPNGVTSINRYAFYGCTGLTSMNISDNVTSIGDFAFYGCNNIVYFTLPNSLTSIGNSAFIDCINLTDVYCAADNVPYVDNPNNTFTNPGNITLYVPSTSLEAYKSTDPWKYFKRFYYLNNNTTQNQEKCSKPTISIVDEKFIFSCETPHVNYRWSISTLNGNNGYGNSTSQITLNVYATKNGYQNSDVTTYEFPSLVGDVNNDGKVNVADHVNLSDIIMNK